VNRLAAEKEMRVLYPAKLFFFLHRIKKGREREKERNSRVLIGEIMLSCSLLYFSTNRRLFL